jgi:hypothetical protein
MLEGMRLKEPFEKLPNNIAEFYGQKIELHDEMSKMATAMTSGPKPGVDYTAMAAEAPKLSHERTYRPRVV